MLSSPARTSTSARPERCGLATSGPRARAHDHRSRQPRTLAHVAKHKRPRAPSASSNHRRRRLESNEIRNRGVFGGCTRRSNSDRLSGLGVSGERGTVGKQSLHSTASGLADRDRPDPAHLSRRSSPGSSALLPLRTRYPHRSHHADHRPSHTSRTSRQRMSVASAPPPEVDWHAAFA
jgi:hypothetical protein